MDGFGQPVALQIAVGGLFDGAPLTQVVDLFVEQFPVEGVGMVEVDGVAFLVGHVRRVVVVGVERHDGHIMGRQGLNNFLHDGGFAAAGPASDANDGGLVLKHFLCVLCC